MTGPLTPCGVLFEVLKKRGGINYQELASLILSGRPLADGRSPASRASDRTWVSRFVVHAPVGSLQEKYFRDFGSAALGIIARLKSNTRRAMTSEQVLDIVRGEGCDAMAAALAACHQDAQLYRNVLDRLLGGEGYTVDEHVEAIMVLFVAAGCSGDARRAAAYTVEYARSIHGSRLATTPASMLRGAGAGGAEHGGEDAGAEALHLGLLRVVDGYVKGSPHWIDPAGDGVEIGDLALGPDDVIDVGEGVSARHARVWRGDDGRWYVQGLGSRNGTVLVSGADRSRTVVEAPYGQRSSSTEDYATAADAHQTTSQPVELHPGDDLILATDTVFSVIEGMPE